MSDISHNKNKILKFTHDQSNELSFGLLLCLTRGESGIAREFQGKAINMQQP